MKFKDFVFSNSKKIVGSALLLSLMAVQTVGATGGITDSLKSKGNIEYDANGDGQADVYFYSKDLTTIAGGVEDINSNMAILSQSFTDLTAASNGYKSDIIAGLNSNVYAKNNIAADATFEDIISKINNIPAPTTATGNVWSGGDNSGIGITSNGQSVNIDGVTSLNLAVNESVTLPSGYYPNDITISNNVANRGSQSQVLTTNNNAVTFQPGYYDEFTVSTDIINIPGVITYKLVHQHVNAKGAVSSNTYESTSGGCFTKAHPYTYTTKECHGETFIWTHDDGSGGYKDEEGYRTVCKDVTKSATNYQVNCGYSVGDYVRDTQDFSSIQNNEKISSVTIDYE